VKTLPFWNTKHNQETTMNGKIIIQVDQMYVKRLIWCGQIGIRKSIGKAVSIGRKISGTTEER